MSVNIEHSEHEYSGLNEPCLRQGCSLRIVDAKNTVVNTISQPVAWLLNGFKARTKQSYPIVLRKIYLKKSIINDQIDGFSQKPLLKVDDISITTSGIVYLINLTV